MTNPFAVYLALSLLIVACIIILVITIRSLKKSYLVLAELRNKIKYLENDRNIFLSKMAIEKDESVRDKVMLMAQNLYDQNPSEAFNFLQTMVTNANPKIRSNAVKAMTAIPTMETFDMLLKLYNDTDTQVKAEVLKNVSEMHKKIGAGELKVDPLLKEKISNLVKEEKLKNEWIL